MNVLVQVQVCRNLSVVEVERLRWSVEVEVEVELELELKKGKACSTQFIRATSSIGFGNPVQCKYQGLFHS